MNIRPLAAAALLLVTLPAAAQAAGFDKAVIALPGNVPVLDTPFGPVEVLATGAQTGGAVGIFRTTEPPGELRPMLGHHGEDEIFYVLEGQYRFTVGDDVMEVGPGATIIIPRDMLNAHENIGDTEGHLLVLEVPGGFEQFFVDVADQKITEPGPAMELAFTRGIFLPAP